jgi:hypothetical protein
LVLEKITSNGSTYPQRSDEAFAIILPMPFVFAFILHVMKNIVRIIDMLCPDLQQNLKIF